VLSLTEQEYKRFIDSIFQAEKMSDLTPFALETLESTRQALAEENENLPQ
jgi:hypothetical protein|tara:strand:- start:3692 stop:3841 length:150 start_codon:yes stop_codon:yes gene_type:complete